MNNESGSALQKASFALLVLIAAAFAYLIVRDRIRSRDLAISPESAVDSAPQDRAPAIASSPTEMKSSFAPLRPRIETNSTRVVIGQTIVSPRNTVAINKAASTEMNPLAADVPAPTLSAVAPAAIGVNGGGRGQKVSVVGRVTLRGTPPAEKPIQLDPMCSQLHPAPMSTRHFLVGRDDGLGNVFVYVKEGAATDSAPQSSIPVLDNVACEFQPYVLGVRAGQPFTLRNSDPVLHNMHVLPSPGGGNREFNIGMPTKNATTTKVFNKPEVFIKVKCDVHPWMFAYIGVVDHPFFAVTDNNGNFALPAGLPKGRYTVAAVHLKAGESVQELNVSEGGPPPLNFTLNVPQTVAQGNPR